MKKTSSRLISIGILIMILFTSCKKQPLDGDMSSLVGSWKWTHVIRSTPAGIGQPPAVDTINASYEFELHFHECGRVDFIREGKRSRKERIVGVLYDKEPDGEEGFVLEFPRSEDQYVVRIKDDILWTRTWPINTEDENSDFGGETANFQNFFTPN